MCIIVSKPKNVEMPSKEILRNCFEYNSDGAGFMYVKNNKVHINKGFMTFEKFYDAIEKLGKVYNLKEHVFVMHFRISTSGNVDMGNCHPYPITTKEDSLRTTQFITDVGMAHNGIITSFSRKNGVLNDTQLFIKECVAPIKKLSADFLRNKDIMKLFDTIASSKLCFLDSDENLHFVGEFIEDEGVMYSNTTYLTRISYPYYSSYYYNGIGGIGGYKYGGAISKKYDDKYGQLADFKNYNDYGYYDNYDNYDDYDDYDDLNLSSILVEPLENMLFDIDENDVLTDSQYDLLMKELIALELGDMVTINGVTWEVTTDKVFYFDNYFNLYKVDADKYRIDLMAKDIDILM